MNSYEQKREARIEGLKARAERLASESETAIASARAKADCIPFGQPILVGHHSERRHRRALDRIDAGFRKGFALADEAEDCARRAERAERNTSISSDDPDAIAKLHEQIAQVERAQVAAKAANKLLRASAHPPTGDVIRRVAELLGWEPERTAAWLGTLHSMGRRTLTTTNGGAEIRRLKARIELLEKRAAAPPKGPEEIGDVRIEETDNRVRVFFQGKPSEDVRSALKRNGFRWSPTVGAWQSYVTHWAWQVARNVASSLLLPEVKP